MYVKENFQSPRMFVSFPACSPTLFVVQPERYYRFFFPDMTISGRRTCFVCSSLFTKALKESS